MWHSVMMNMTRYIIVANYVQPQFGHHKTCIQNSEERRYCVLQYFHSMEADEAPLLNGRDCPIVLLSNTFWCIPSKRILTPVSIVHECDSKFTLQVTRKRKLVEREQCEFNSFSLCHNYNMFVGGSIAKRSENHKLL